MRPIGMIVGILAFCQAATALAQAQTTDFEGRRLAELAAQAVPAPTYADVAYAPADPVGTEGHLLDVYLPKDKDASRPYPVVLWTAGSAWRADNGRTRAGWIVQQLLPRGYAVIGVSVRSSEQAVFPAQVHDIKAAIRFVKANAARFHIDPERIAVVGTSSGAWAASMAAVTGDHPELEGEIGTKGPSSRIKAAVAFWPPTNFAQMDAWAVKPCAKIEYRGVEGFCHDDATSPESTLVGCAIQTCPDRVAAASPMTYVGSNSAPILIVHGQSDPFVPHNQGEALYQAYNKACAEATFISLPKLLHGPWPEALTDPELAAGATRRSTRAADCTVEMPVPYYFSRSSLFEFLDQNL